MNKILNDPNVKSLIETFDLKAPTERLEVSQYEFNSGLLEIKEIKVLDIQGNFLRLADLKKVVPHLSKYYVTFKSGIRE